MQLITLRPRKLKSSLYKLHLKENINVNDFDNFEQNLKKLISGTETGEANNQTEEYFKNLLKTFLEKTYYENKNFLNTMSYKGQNEADLVIHSGKEQDSKVSVIFEVKKPKNKSEMPSYDNIFKKAFFEAILYFLWEVVDKQNLEVKNLVITNIYEYFIFDARDIKRVFLDKSTKLENTFKKWRTNQLTDDKTDTMYQEIENYVNAHQEFFDNIRFTWFDIRNIQEEDRKHLFKIFSPKHLLREVLTNDSNSLNKDFYNELLHIIGLEEVEKDNKKLIQRKKTPDPASILENTINVIDSKDKLDNVSNLSYFGINNNERIYNISLSLCIRWVNRILFLKLLEGQLYKYHNDKSYKFLDSDKINSFDKLNRLFFSVLAKKTEDRNQNIQNEYFRIPYLNSSLFELSPLENEAIDISQLENNLEMPVYKSSVLKDNRGKKFKGEIPNLKYLLDFLNSYDFGSEGENELNQENKTLINASVLGLIFEKINGYKDGSFYTPGFITTYMCRESIQRAVIQKFNDKYSWNCESINDLYNKLERVDIKEANEIVDSLKICDPAVGSGHFLVSALNEIIALKSELGILCDTEGKKLRGFKVENFNDELVITDEDDNFFEYKVTEHTDLQPVTRKIPKEKTRVQKALFFEKKHLIENCLFGVDINNNSVMICRLRLWIELLKSAFYTEESNYTELETLPNIDINIKQGNSLISRYDLDVNLGQVFNKEGFRVKNYREAVSNYKESKSRADKKIVLEYLDNIKKQFKTELAQGFLTKIHGLELEIRQMESSLFGVDKETKKKIAEKQKKLDEMLLQKEEIEKSEIYKDAFEWRFEFPEVLDSDGSFTGFDLVIGNPPYFNISTIEKKFFKYLSERYIQIHTGYNDIVYYFISLGIEILKETGCCSLITSNYFLGNDYANKLRFFLSKYISKIVNFKEHMIFDTASIHTCISLSYKNPKSDEITFYETTADNQINSSNIEEDLKSFSIERTSLNDNWIIANKAKTIIFNKLKSDSMLLGDISIIEKGSTSGKNEVFTVSDNFAKSMKFENSILRKNIKNGDIDKYTISNRGNLLIYIDNNIRVEDFPNIFSYLKSQKEILMNRNEVKQGLYPWYRFERPRSKDIFDAVEKIVVPYRAKNNRFAYDDKQYFNDGGDIRAIVINNRNFNIKYVLAILNSNLMNWYYEFIGKLKGNLREYFNKPLSIIPIKNLFQESQKPFISLVDQILENKKQNIDTTELERKIDEMVYKLYDLTEDEIKIIEEEK